MRLRGFHYGGGAAYFVTACTRNRDRVLATVVAGHTIPSMIGRIVDAQWHDIPAFDPAIQLDEWIIMPDHLHGILRFGADARTTLPRIMAWLKGTSVATARVQGVWGHRPLWQRGYYDRIIRGEQAMNRIRQYVRSNPTRWSAR